MQKTWQERFEDLQQEVVRELDLACPGSLVFTAFSDVLQWPIGRDDVMAAMIQETSNLPQDALFFLIHHEILPSCGDPWDQSLKMPMEALVAIPSEVFASVCQTTAKWPGKPRGTLWATKANFSVPFIHEGRIQVKNRVIKFTATESAQKSLSAQAAQPISK